MTIMTTRETTIEVPMTRAMKKVTMKVVVTATKRMRVRLWLGAQIIRFAGAVIGCNVEVGIKSPDDDKVE